SSPCGPIRETGRVAGREVFLPPHTGGLALALDTRIYGALLRRGDMLRRPEALGAHKWLVGERLTLICAVIATGAPPNVTLALLGATLAATYTAQGLLRDRYEQPPASLAVSAAVTSPAPSASSASLGAQTTPSMPQPSQGS
ncbi:MAG TPA: hypothetical protein VFN78_15310, partial [Ktedonobacterales bacterium]|nr:hypothetical protein [Ktedonobacterales bacterium]